MMLNAIVLLLLVLMTLYLSTQGMLSSLIALITSIFGSLLAMSLMEPLSFLVGKWRLDYAHGATLMLLFVVAFAVTRFAADALVPRNIKLPMLVNRAAGGFFGFFTSLVVLGTLLLGVEMMPLPRSILGYDRFPTENTMQADGVTTGDLTKKASNIWFAPDQFVAGIWGMVSGKSLGGNNQWADVHPDIVTELYGYRNSVVKGSARALAPSLFSVQGVWTSTDAKDLEGLGVTAEGSRNKLVMVRVKVDKGDKENASNDPPDDSYFRVSATQIRMVTDKGEQFYPSGYLEQGRHFRPLTLDSGHLVEDYANGSIFEDWIFLIPEAQTPKTVEMKELARQDLAIKPGKPNALVASSYPPLSYLKDLSTVSVKFDPGKEKLESAYVYLIDAQSPRQVMDSELNPAYANVEKISGWLNQNSNNWSRDKQNPGTPEPNLYRAVEINGQRMTNDQPDAPEQWVLAIPIILAGQATSDGQENLRAYKDFFEEHMKPLWSNTKGGSVLHGRDVADATGNAQIPHIVTGSYLIVAAMKTDKGFSVWAMPFSPKQATNQTLTCTAGAGNGGSLIFSIDMDTGTAP